MSFHVTLDVISPAGVVGMGTYADVDRAVRAFLDTIPLDGGSERVRGLLTSLALRIGWQGKTTALGIFDPSPSGGKWPVCIVTSRGGFTTYVATVFGWERN
jgi:hypothetical protein